MFGPQTMFDCIWSQNISPLDRAPDKGNNGPFGSGKNVGGAEVI